jgi:hypothetical protein
MEAGEHESDLSRTAPHGTPRMTSPSHLPPTVRSTDGPRRGPSARWGVTKCCIDRDSVAFSFREAAAPGMPLSLRQGLMRALPEFLARFEISRRKDAGAGILARSRRPENHVRHCLS